MDSQEKALTQGQSDVEKTVEETTEVNNRQAGAETPAAAPEAEVKEQGAGEAVPAVENAAEPEAESPEAESEEEAVSEEPAAEAAAEDAAPAPKEETPAEPAASEDEAKAAEDFDHKEYSTKAEVLERVRQLAHDDENPSKAEVEHLKTCFYKLHLAQREAEQKAYIEAGGEPEKYQVLPDDQEEEFKAEMALIKEKRSKMFHEQEEERKQNYERKLAIIEKIKGMATSPDAANKAFPEFKALQQEWKEIKGVPPEKANELWRNYQHYVEQFYDLLNLNREAREYDFKKNLELKTRLCEEAEKLAEEPDVIKAFHKLQELHQEYREAGPVAKDKREEVWARFKAASTVINKKHQQHFEELRSKEKENLEKKTALCEKVEQIAKEENKKASDWERHTKEIIGVQAEWKTIGFAPQKMNVKIFERFRAACDDFFTRKAEFFKGLKQEYQQNAEKKRALVEKAKELAESTEWKSTADKLIELQKEWKTIGMVPHRLGDQLWKEFNAACNKFFEARNAATGSQRGEERQNLGKKRDIIKQLKDILTEAGDDAKDKVQQLVDQYNSIGHVPYKEKDKVYDEFRETLDKVYKSLGISAVSQRLDKYRSSLRGMAKRGEEVVDNERARLMRQYEQMKSDIITYENNLGFLNASSKKGNSLIGEMNKRVEKLKEELDLVRQKIKAIDKQNSSQEDEQKPADNQ